MSWGGIFGFFFIALIMSCFFVPIWFYFSITHQQQWLGTVTIKLFCWQYTIQSTDTKWIEKATHSTGQSLKPDWAAVWSFGREALHILAQKLYLQHLSIACRIGWERADYTAYGYGLFWAAVSALPIHWLERSDILYEPDFQTVKKEVAVQGIIRCSAAQLIGMIAALFLLTLRTMLRQNRKEQVSV